MRRLFAAATLALPLLLGAVSADAMQLREDGVHTEDWVKSMSFLDLKEDVQEAADAGKSGLVIIFEQPGCGSCKKLHEVNFQEQSVVDTITQNFDVLIMNMYGANEVTDFDGEVLSEADFAAKTMINFSPTTLFYDVSGKEVFRVPGYMSPYFYQSAFEYVVDDGPAKGVLFPRWLKAKRDRLAADKAANPS